MKRYDCNFEQILDDDNLEILDGREFSTNLFQWNQFDDGPPSIDDLNELMGKVMGH